MSRRAGRSARALLVALLVGACGSGLPELPSARRSPEPQPHGGEVIVGGVGRGSVIASLPDGSLLVGVRATGTVLEADGAGHVDPDPVAQIEVSSEGDRGLLGLAIDKEERVFASYTDREGRLRVSQVAPGDPIDVWIGPQTTARGIGGALVIDPEGRLVIGVGAMGAIATADDPGVPNAKILRLDPASGIDQEPAILSAGWREPRAFAFGPEGALWVLDRRPDGPGVLARGDGGDGAVVPTVLTDVDDPRGLAALGSERLVICDAVNGSLVPFTVLEDRAMREGAPLVPDCAGAAVQLADGRLAYVADGSIKTLLI